MLRARFGWLLPATLLCLSTASGCALTGRTRPQQVDAPQDVDSHLEIAAVGLESGQTRLQNVGTFAWGEYGERDLDVLRQTLTEAVSPVVPQSHRVHVVVRRFLVAHSNNEGFALACVAWALTDPSGALVYHEQFYASDHVRVWGTIGGVKNHVHEGVARHVVRQASLVAAGREPEAVGSQYVHATYEAATADLPASLRSVHVGALALGGGYAVRVYEGSSEVDWARQADHLDWPALLASAS